MIKARIKENIIIGLSEVNVHRLKHDMPIRFNLKELGLSDNPVFIIYGRTEHDLTQMIQPGVGPNTAVYYKPEPNIFGLIINQELRYTERTSEEIQKIIAVLPEGTDYHVIQDITNDFKNF